MGLFFAPRPGRVAVLPDFSLPISVALTGWQGAQTMRAALTRLAFGEAVNLQLAPMLRDFIYAYVFGDLPVALSVGGIAFAGLCDDDSGITGLDQLYDYYGRWRVSNQGQPVSLAVGSLVRYQGLLTNMACDLSDPAFGMGRFELQIKAVRVD